MQGDEEQATIVSIGPHENIFASTRQEDIFVGSPSSSTSQDPPDSAQTTEVAQGQTEPNIFAKYKAIKQKNEMLKASTYTQF